MFNDRNQPDEFYNIRGELEKLESINVKAREFNYSYADILRQQLLPVLKSLIESVEIAQKHEPDENLLSNIQTNLKTLKEYTETLITAANDRYTESLKSTVESVKHNLHLIRAERERFQKYMEGQTFKNQLALEKSNKAIGEKFLHHDLSLTGLSEEIEVVESIQKTLFGYEQVFGYGKYGRDWWLYKIFIDENKVVREEIVASLDSARVYLGTAEWEGTQQATENQIAQVEKAKQLTKTLQIKFINLLRDQSNFVVRLTNELNGLLTVDQENKEPPISETIKMPEEWEEENKPTIITKDIIGESFSLQKSLKSGNSALIRSQLKLDEVKQSLDEHIKTLKSDIIELSKKDFTLKNLMKIQNTTPYSPLLKTLLDDDRILGEYQKKFSDQVTILQSYKLLTMDGSMQVHKNQAYTPITTKAQADSAMQEIAACAQFISDVNTALKKHKENIEGNKVENELESLQAIINKRRNWDIAIDLIKKISTLEAGNHALLEQAKAIQKRTANEEDLAGIEAIKLYKHDISKDPTDADELVNVRNESHLTLLSEKEKLEKLVTQCQETEILVKIKDQEDLNATLLKLVDAVNHGEEDAKKRVDRPESYKLIIENLKIKNKLLVVISDQNNDMATDCLLYLIGLKNDLHQHTKDILNLRKKFDVFCNDATAAGLPASFLEASNIEKLQENCKMIEEYIKQYAELNSPESLTKTSSPITDIETYTKITLDAKELLKTSQKELLETERKLALDKLDAIESYINSGDVFIPHVSDKYDYSHKPSFINALTTELIRNINFEAIEFDEIEKFNENAIYEVVKMVRKHLTEPMNDKTMLTLAREYNKALEKPLIDCYKFENARLSLASAYKNMAEFSLSELEEKDIDAHVDPINLRDPDKWREKTRPPDFFITKTKVATGIINKKLQEKLTKQIEEAQKHLIEINRTINSLSKPDEEAQVFDTQLKDITTRYADYITHFINTAKLEFSNNAKETESASEDIKFDSLANRLTGYSNSLATSNEYRPGEFTRTISKPYNSVVRWNRALSTFKENCRQFKEKIKELESAEFEQLTRDEIYQAIDPVFKNIEEKTVSLHFFIENIDKANKAIKQAEEAINENRRAKGELNQARTLAKKQLKMIEEYIEKFSKEHADYNEKFKKAAELDFDEIIKDKHDKNNSLVIIQYEILKTEARLNESLEGKDTNAIKTECDSVEVWNATLGKVIENYEHFNAVMNALTKDELETACKEKGKDWVLTSEEIEKVIDSRLNKIMTTDKPQAFIDNAELTKRAVIEANDKKIEENKHVVDLDKQITELKQQYDDLLQKIKTIQGRTAKNEDKESIQKIEDDLSQSKQNIPVSNDPRQSRDYTINLYKRFNEDLIALEQTCLKNEKVIKLDAQKKLQNALQAWLVVSKDEGADKNVEPAATEIEQEAEIELSELAKLIKTNKQLLTQCETYLSGLPNKLEKCKTDLDTDINQINNALGNLENPQNDVLTELNTCKTNITNSKAALEETIKLTIPEEEAEVQNGGIIAIDDVIAQINNYAKTTSTAKDRLKISQEQMLKTEAEVKRLIQEQERIANLNKAKGRLEEEKNKASQRWDAINKYIAGFYVDIQSAKDTKSENETLDADYIEKFITASKADFSKNANVTEAGIKQADKDIIQFDELKNRLSQPVVQDIESVNHECTLVTRWNTVLETFQKNCEDFDNAKLNLESQFLKKGGLIVSDINQFINLALSKTDINAPLSFIEKINAATKAVEEAKKAKLTQDALLAKLEEEITELRNEYDLLLGNLEDMAYEAVEAEKVAIETFIKDTENKVEEFFKLKKPPSIPVDPATEKVAVKSFYTDVNKDLIGKELSLKISSQENLQHALQSLFKDIQVAQQELPAIKIDEKPPYVMDVTKPRLAQLIEVNNYLQGNCETELNRLITFISNREDVAVDAENPFSSEFKDNKDKLSECVKSLAESKKQLDEAIQQPLSVNTIISQVNTCAENTRKLTTQLKSITAQDNTQPARIELLQAQKEAKATLKLIAEKTAAIAKEHKTTLKIVDAYFAACQSEFNQNKNETIHFSKLDFDKSMREKSLEAINTECNQVKTLNEDLNSLSTKYNNLDTALKARKAARDTAKLLNVSLPSFTPPNEKTSDHWITSINNDTVAILKLNKAKRKQNADVADLNTQIETLETQYNNLKQTAENIQAITNDKTMLKAILSHFKEENESIEKKYLNQPVQLKEAQKECVASVSQQLTDYITSGEEKLRKDIVNYRETSNTALTAVDSLLKVIDKAAKWLNECDSKILPKPILPNIETLNALQKRKKNLAGLISGINGLETEGVLSLDSNTWHTISTSISIFETDTDKLKVINQNKQAKEIKQEVSQYLKDYKAAYQKAEKLKALDKEIETLNAKYKELRAEAMAAINTTKNIENKKELNGLDTIKARKINEAEETIDDQQQLKEKKLLVLRQANNRMNNLAAQCKKRKDLWEQHSQYQYILKNISTKVEDGSTVLTGDQALRQKPIAELTEHVQNEKEKLQRIINDYTATVNQAVAAVDSMIKFVKTQTLELNKCDTKILSEEDNPKPNLSNKLEQLEKSKQELNNLINQMKTLPSTVKPGIEDIEKKFSIITLNIKTDVALAKELPAQIAEQQEKLTSEIKDYLEAYENAAKRAKAIEEWNNQVKEFKENILDEFTDNFNQAKAYKVNKAELFNNSCKQLIDAIAKDAEAYTQLIDDENKFVGSDGKKLSGDDIDTKFNRTVKPLMDRLRSYNQALKTVNEAHQNHEAVLNRHDLLLKLYPIGEQITFATLFENADLLPEVDTENLSVAEKAEMTKQRLAAIPEKLENYIRSIQDETNKVRGNNGTLQGKCPAYLHSKYPRQNKEITAQLRSLMKEQKAVATRIKRLKALSIPTLGAGAIKEAMEAANKKLTDIQASITALTKAKKDAAQMSAISLDVIRQQLNSAFDNNKAEENPIIATTLTINKNIDDAREILDRKELSIKALEKHYTTEIREYRANVRKMLTGVNQTIKDLAKEKNIPASIYERAAKVMRKHSEEAASLIEKHKKLSMSAIERVVNEIVKKGTVEKIEQPQQETVLQKKRIENVHANIEIAIANRLTKKTKTYHSIWDFSLNQNHQPAPVSSQQEQENDSAKIAPFDLITEITMAPKIKARNMAITEWNAVNQELNQPEEIRNELSKAMKIIKAKIAQLEKAQALLGKSKDNDIDPKADVLQAEINIAKNEYLRLESILKKPTFPFFNWGAKSKKYDSSWQDRDSASKARLLLEAKLQIIRLEQAELYLELTKMKSCNAMAKKENQALYGEKIETQKTEIKTSLQTMELQKSTSYREWRIEINNLSLKNSFDTFRNKTEEFNSEVADLCGKLRYEPILKSIKSLTERRVPAAAHPVYLPKASSVSDELAAQKTSEKEPIGILAELEEIKKRYEVEVKRLEELKIAAGNKLQMNTFNKADGGDYYIISEKIEKYKEHIIPTLQRFTEDLRLFLKDQDTNQLADKFLIVKCQPSLSRLNKGKFEFTSGERTLNAMGIKIGEDGIHPHPETPIRMENGMLVNRKSERHAFNKENLITGAVPAAYLYEYLENFKDEAFLPKQPKKDAWGYTVEEEDVSVKEEKKDFGIIRTGFTGFKG